MSSIEWAKNNPDEYEKWKKKKVRCNDCDSIISNGYRKQHEKSKKHLKSIGQLDQCIVIKKNKSKKESLVEYCEACDRYISAGQWKNHLNSNFCKTQTDHWNNGFKYSVFIDIEDDGFLTVNIQFPPKTRKTPDYDTLKNMAQKKYDENPKKFMENLN